MKLCKYCNSRFSNYFDEGECHICNGDVEKFLTKLTAALADFSLTIENAKYFSLSTHIPKHYLAREEDAFDYLLGSSLKYQLNGEIRKIIEKSLGLSYDVEKADVRFLIDFPSAAIKEKAEDYFVYGLYKKLKPNISQKRWVKYERSVEAVIGEKLKSFLKAKRYYMHASGREDADAINIAGRPFVMELQEAYYRASSKELASFRIEGDVEAELIARVRRSFVTIVSDSHFDKCYRAYLSSKETSELSLDKLTQACKALEGVILRQRTPTRVLRRRADKIRRRKIYSCAPGKDERGYYVDVCAEAGTYIKELISGDNGRTTPSLSSLLGIPVVCSFLIVKHINHSFLNTVMDYARV